MRVWLGKFDFQVAMLGFRAFFQSSDVQTSDHDW